MKEERKRIVPEPTPAQKEQMLKEYEADKWNRTVCIGIAVLVLLVVGTLSKCGVLHTPTPLENIENVAGETVEIFENLKEAFQEDYEDSTEVITVIEQP